MHPSFCPGSGVLTEVLWFDESYSELHYRYESALEAAEVEERLRLEAEDAERLRLEAEAEAERLGTEVFSGGLFFKAEAILYLLENGAAAGHGAF